MGMDTLKATIVFGGSYQAQKNVAGSGPVGSNFDPTMTFSLGTTVANNLSGGANELISKVYTIAGAGTVTIDLTALVDVLLQSAVSLARLKWIEFALLSSTATTGAVDATNGTAASQVTIGNAGANPNAMFLGAGTHTIVLKNGEAIRWASPQAAGILVGAAKNVLITNNDAGVTAAVKVTFGGGDT